MTTTVLLSLLGLCNHLSELGLTLQIQAILVNYFNLLRLYSLITPIHYVTFFAPCVLRLLI